MDTPPIGSTSATGANTRVAPPETAVPPATETPQPGQQALPSLRLLLADLQATLMALATLARSELHLSLALLLRASVLAIIGLLMLALAILLGSALLVASGLALGLSWPAALAVSLIVLVLACWACWARASRHLGECGLPRTREQLAALWPEPSP